MDSEMMQVDPPERKTDIETADTVVDNNDKMEEDAVKSEEIGTDETSKKRSFDEVEGKQDVNDSNDVEVKKEEGEDKEIKVEDSTNGDDTPMTITKIEEIGESDIIVPVVKPKLSYIPLKTGLCYDVRMRYHAKIFTSYFEYIDPHPEDPRRIYRIYKILAENGLINDPTLSGRDDIGDLMVKIPVREATKDEILTVHTEEHLKFIESTQAMSKEQLLKETEKGDSVYFNNDSLLSAKLSCGGAIEAYKAVIEGRVKNSLAVVRPPGHHAEPDAPGGFCLFSNVAVAAKTILRDYQESVRRIVILDWDVHHGNGTQKAFFDDPRVLYISLHRYEQGKYYPGTKAGGADQVGEGPGEGFNVNIPWPVGGMGDADYLYAFRKVVMPICQEFNADLIVISAGFDAADGDVIGGCHVSPAGYGHMTHLLKGLAKGNLCVVLEGGYNLDAIANSALRVAKVLLGEPPEELKEVIPKAETIQTIDDVIKIQSNYWRSLRPGYSGQDYSLPNIMGSYEELIKKSVDPTFESMAAKYSKLPDAIRAHQSHELFDKRGFISLPILSDKKLDSESLSEQVLCSPNIYSAETIVIIIHDPARIWARRDPITGILDSNSSVIVDKSLSFIDWAIKEEYGVIDINVPISITGSEDINYNNINSSQDILLYVWDNYIQYFSNLEKLAFVGIGDSYNGVVHLCGHRDVRNLVKVSVNFLDRPTALRAIVSSIDESIVDWFYRNSLVFTSLKHPCWGGSDINGGSNDSNGFNGSGGNGGAGGSNNANGGNGSNGSNGSSGSNGAMGSGMNGSNVGVGGSINGGSEAIGYYSSTKKPRKKYGRVLRADCDGLDNVIDERFEEATEFILDCIEEYESDDSSD